jgi:hypothetical protein
LNCKYAILNTEQQEGKIGSFWEWIPVGGGGHKDRVNVVDVFCIHVFLTFIDFLKKLFYHFYIYLHVYTLFGPHPLPPTPLLGRTCSALLFSILLKRKHKR